MKIDIPGMRTFTLENLILDYNGTIAKDGILLEEARKCIRLLENRLRIHVITADTFGSVSQAVKDLDVTVKILQSREHTVEKSEYISSLGAEKCIAIGNGNNDALMLKHAAIGIALLGDEGCSVKTLGNSDVLCKNIRDALELIIHPKRLIATLRS